MMIYIINAPRSKLLFKILFICKDSLETIGIIIKCVFT